MARVAAATIRPRCRELSPGERPPRASPLLVYPLIALLAFPTLGTLLHGTAAWVFTLDVFDDGGACRGWRSRPGTGRSTA